jgi:hypothetical protein
VWWLRGQIYGLTSSNYQSKESPFHNKLPLDVRRGRGRRGIRKQLRQIIAATSTCSGSSLARKSYIMTRPGTLQKHGVLNPNIQFHIFSRCYLHICHQPPWQQT